MLILQLALLGGLFAILSFIHFFVDWIFQSHAEAMVKHNNPRVRAKHCLIYTIGFIPLFAFCNFSFLEWALATNILFWSHFCEDTYIPVFLWAKYIRKPPEMFDLELESQWKGACKDMDRLSTDSRLDRESVIEFFGRTRDKREAKAKTGFVEFIQTAMGKILMIAIDQIIHLVFLLPIAWMILRNI
jgi:hypothetical protein